MCLGAQEGFSEEVTFLYPASLFTCCLCLKAAETCAETRPSWELDPIFHSTCGKMLGSGRSRANRIMGNGMTSKDS